MTAYKFATDSECGTIDAESFEAACRKLDAMVTDSDCGSGWVEDTDGFRYETKGEATVEGIGNGYYEAADGTVCYNPDAAQLDALESLRGTTGHHSDLAKQVEALGFAVLEDSDNNELSTIRLVGVWGKDGEDIVVGSIRGDAEAVIE